MIGYPARGGQQATAARLPAVKRGGIEPRSQRQPATPRRLSRYALALRILAVSDLRVQSVALLEGVAERTKPDLIVYGGDDVVRFGPGSNSWAALAARTRFGLAGVIGNDCLRLHARAFDQPNCHDLDRAPLVLPGLAILGLGGAPRDEAGAIGYTLYTREEATEQLERQLAQVGRRKVLLVSHAPPFGVLDIAVRFGVAHVGSSVVRAFLDRPQVRGVVCGHVHSHGGQVESIGETVVVNIASHDNLSASLKYAIMDWDGRHFTVTPGIARDNDAITRVPGIGSVTAQRLALGGIASVRELLAGDGRDVASIAGVGVRTARRLRASARAARDRVPVLLEPDAPFPDDAVIVDVETSADRADDPWLVGLKAWGDEPVQQFEELDASRHADHLGRVGVALGRWPGAALVRWGTFDRAPVERAHRRLAVEVPAWVDRSWFDACAWMKRVVALPVDGAGLKSVAAHFGYVFAHVGIDGFTVGKWYTLYRDEGAPFDVAKVRSYNRDDVLAVEHVVRAVQKLARSKTVMIEPQIPGPRHHVSSPQRPSPAPAMDPGVVPDAVAKYAASLVRRGDLDGPAQARAVAKYAASMQGRHATP